MIYNTLYLSHELVIKEIQYKNIRQNDKRLWIIRGNYHECSKIIIKEQLLEWVLGLIVYEALIVMNSKIILQKTNRHWMMYDTICKTSMIKTQKEKIK